MTDPRDRVEPSLPDDLPEELSLPVDRPEGDAPPESAPSAVSRVRALLSSVSWRTYFFALAGVVMLALSAAMLVYWREPLGRLLVPDAPLTQQLVDAQAALDRGELSRDDGQGARELFQAALAVDADNPAARQGLQDVRDAALTRADEALTSGEIDAAREALALATTLSAPAADLAPLEARLRTLDAASQDVERDLQSAQALLAQGDEGDALDIFERILASDPANAVALDGRRAVLSRWLQQANQALDRDDLDAAQAQVDGVLAHDPSHLELPAVQARLGEARTEKERARLAQLESAEKALRDGDLTAAWRVFQSLLKAEPGFAPANAGTAKVIEAMVSKIESQLLTGELSDASENLKHLRAWVPESTHVARLQAQLQRAESARSPTPVVNDPRRVPQLLAKADAAIKSGHLLAPNGSSAWDLLQSAAAIAPHDAAVNQSLDRFEEAARQCFSKHVLANRLTDAEVCLQARALRESPQVLADARRRLALRWLAFGNERIGQNEPELARRALRAARRLDEQAPGLHELESRLNLVFGSGRQ